MARRTLEELTEECNLTKQAGLVVYWFSSSMVANGRVALTKVAASAETKATVSSLCDLQKRRKNAETKYFQVRFPGRNPFPLDLFLGLHTIHFSRLQTEKTVLGGVCKSLEPFIGAVYLAYYDEANRKHSNASLARSLKDLSLNVNSTYASVETLYRTIFQNQSVPRSNNTAGRQSLRQRVVTHKNNFPRETASINELRTYATIKELGSARFDICDALIGVKRFRGLKMNCFSCDATDM